MASAQILIVEDESIVAKGIQHDLRSMGYAVPVIAASGEEAIEKAAETYPDLVLMDVVLKGDMDGIETTRRMRDRFDIPVVYLTAYEDDETLKRAQVTEPFGYLLKPYEEKELHTTIEMALYKHRMERKLKETQQWLTGTLRCIGDAVIATDARQSIKFINPAAETLTGWSRGDACGKSLPEVFHSLDEATYTLVENASRQAFKKGVPSELPSPSTLVARDGRQTPVEGVVSAILDDDGFFSGFVWVFRDVSDRLRAEEERRQNEDQLRQAQKMEAVTRLAGGVAHNFNDLLTVILGNTTLVLSNLAPSDPHYDSVVAVETAAVRAAELVKQLLGFSGRSHLSLETVDLNAAVHDVLDVLAGILNPRISLEFDSAPDLGTVEADPAQVEEILMNLCLTARDAMPEGGELRLATDMVVLGPDDVRKHRRAKPGDYVRLSIQDSGPGIPPDLRPRIFEPFVTTRELGSGMGLGLALVYGIVEQHRGWIECHSERGKGTRFEVYLPSRRQETASAAEAPAVRLARSDSKTILVVDDEPMIRELGKTILEGHGYHVLLAEDGAQAVAMYQRELGHIDLVILDLTMPRMSGCDAFQQLLAIDPHVHVLFASGYFAEDVTAEDDRILGFITKPYRHDDLINMVRAALEQIKAAP